MMAFDRTPSQPTLDPATLDALRTALARSVADGTHADGLRELLCKTTDEARAKDMTAERLLVILKDLWHSLPEVANAVSTDAQHRLLQELVSRCIQEYYSI